MRAIVFGLALLIVPLAQNTQPAGPTPSSYQIPVPGTFNLSISPDGRTIVYSAPAANGLGPLFVRPIEPTGTAKPLAGTEGASYPFWSPDGRTIAFGKGREIYRIPAAGGTAEKVAERGADTFRRGTWGSAGTILFATDVIRRTSVAGSAPADVTKLDTGLAETSHSGPWFLPDGKHFLYKSWSDKVENRLIYIGSLDQPMKKRLLDVTSRAIFVSGHILYTRQDTLFVQPFNPAKLEFSGPAVRIGQGVLFDERLGISAFDASSEGTLIYRTGTMQNSSPTVTVVPKWTSLLKK